MAMNALNSLSQYNSLSALSSPHTMQAAMNALAASTAAAAASHQGSSKSKDYIPTGILRYVNELCLFFFRRFVIQEIGDLVY